MNLLGYQPIVRDESNRRGIGLKDFLPYTVKIPVKGFGSEKLLRVAREILMINEGRHESEVRFRNLEKVCLRQWKF